METPSNRPFYVMVVNTLSASLTLSKNMKAVMLEQVLSIIFPVQEVFQDDSVDAMPIYKEKQNEKRQFAQHQPMRAN